MNAGAPLIGDLSGKTALITGAAGEIGAATAVTLARHGCTIAAVDQPGASWDRLRARLDAEAKLLTLDVDVTNESSVQSYVAKTIEAFGAIDVFFNNAGIEGGVHPVTDYPLETFRKVMAVNVESVFLGLKYVLPVMYRQGSGSVINSSSTAGLRGGPGMIGYCASKHAVLGMTRAAAAEAAPKGVRVNCVNPGPIEGRMMDSIASHIGGGPEAARAAFIKSVPAGRFGKSEEVAAMVAFLASDAAAYCNGAFFAVDGAFTAT